jgi:hypothetical protein
MLFKKEEICFSKLNFQGEELFMVWQALLPLGMRRYCAVVLAVERMRSSLGSRAARTNPTHLK